MSGRPPISGALPVWASTVNYPSGTYAGTPTKMNPGSGFIGIGWLAGVPPAAQFENYYRNLQGLFLTYLDQIDSLNFPEPVTSGISYSNPSGSPWGRLVCWESQQGHYWLASDDTVNHNGAFYSTNGHDWTSDLANLPAPVPISCIDINPSDGFIVGACFTTFHYFYRTVSGGAWVQANLTVAGAGSPIAYWVEYDRFTTGNFLVASVITAHPAVINVVEAGGGLSAAAATLTLTNSATYTGHVEFLASSPVAAFRIALAKVTAPSSGWEIWTNNNLANPWSDTNNIGGGGFVFGTDPVAFTCGDSGIFMATCSGGQVYTTSDGVTWTLKITLGDTPQKQCLASHGSQWLMCASFTGSTGASFYLELSNDNGATWSRVAYPFANTVLPLGITVADGRFHVTGAVTSTLSTAQSLRTR